MTQETTGVNITITPADVDVVLALNPEFKQLLMIAAVARMRAENTQRMADEATEAAKAEETTESED